MLRVHLVELRDSWSAWLGVAIAFIVINILVDVLYVLVNPRIRSV